jgi:hypothetical protein
MSQGNTLAKIVKSYADQIRDRAVQNGTGLYIELLRVDRFRSRGIYSHTQESHDLITQEIWAEICSDPNFRSIRSGWVLA